MQYRLDGLPLQSPARSALLATGIEGDAPDLLEVEAHRRELREDSRVTAGELRVADVSPTWIALRFPGSGNARPVSEDLVPEIRRWVGLGRRQFVHERLESPGTLRRRIERALEERGDSWGGFFLRLEEGCLRAILPHGYEPLDNVEAATAFSHECGRWRIRGVDVRIETCDWSQGDLFLAACAPSLAAEVREGDWLYGGIALSNSESSTTSLEVMPRIYRAVCANGAMTQEAEAEGFEIRKIPEHTPVAGDVPRAEFGERLARAFDLAFRPDRVEHEAAVDRAAAASTLTSPFEHLEHLVARGLLRHEERDLAQRLFEVGDDASLYGLANAVTAAAHRARLDDFHRGSALEHLGAQIARGEHGPPVGVPVYV